MDGWRFAAFEKWRGKDEVSCLTPAGYEGRANVEISDSWLKLRR